mmetsp:Transcript_15450/g.25731  ORF Transcript_15450/g.25731 Transcript_15450/m.25731 type:complete len:94 (-) Transcript_15450:398-679(-)
MRCTSRRHEWRQQRRSGREASMTLSPIAAGLTACRTSPSSLECPSRRCSGLVRERQQREEVSIVEGHGLVSFSAQATVKKEANWFGDGIKNNQ